MLEARFGQLSIDEGHLEIAATSCNIATLITEPTPSILMEAAGHGSLAVMKHLLALGNATTTKEMLIAAVWNSKCTTDMLKLLWPLARHIEVCPKMFLSRDFQTIEPTTDISFLVSRNWLNSISKYT